MSDTPVVNDGPYKESDDFTPSPFDLTGTLDTSGTGGRTTLEDVSKVVEADKAITAQSVLDGTAEVRYAGEETPSWSDQDEHLIQTAKARTAEPVDLGGPAPSEAEGETKVSDQEAQARLATDSQTGASADGKGSTDADATPTASKAETDAKAKEADAKAAKSTSSK